MPRILQVFQDDTERLAPGSLPMRQSILRTWRHSGHFPVSLHLRQPEARMLD
jgi:hypothetical protein